VIKAGAALHRSGAAFGRLFTRAAAGAGPGAGAAGSAGAGPGARGGPRAAPGSGSGGGKAVGLEAAFSTAGAGEGAWEELARRLEAYEGTGGSERHCPAGAAPIARNLERHYKELSRMEVRGGGRPF
jgi:hypothetical protein